MCVKEEYIKLIIEQAVMEVLKEYSHIYIERACNDMQFVPVY